MSDVEQQQGDELFGDSDPEDAWDDNDPPEVKEEILERIAARLESMNPLNYQRRDDALRLLDKMGSHARRRTDNRLDQIRERLEAL